MQTRNRVVVVFALLVGSSFAGVIGQGGDNRRASAAFEDSGHSVPVVRLDVEDALQQQPWTRVVVALRVPDAAAQRPVPRRLLGDQIAATQNRVLATIGDADFHLIYRYESVSGLAGSVSMEGIRKLARDPDVVAVTTDGILAGALAVSVPLINADDVHALGIRGTGVVVGVLDSGVDTGHPDLADSIVLQECRLSGGGCPGGGTSTSGPGAAEDDQGHGTHVAGIITSNGIVAAPGVAPDAQLAAYKVTNAQSQGYTSDIDAALSDIIAHHPEIRIINMSLVSPGTFHGACDDYSPTTTSAINTLWNLGTIAFVAAGNNAVKDGMTFPACISSAVSVGAVWDADYGPVQTTNCADVSTGPDHVACFSNSDSTLDLLAPGTVIVSDFLNGTIEPVSGTSMAAPHAAGTAALLLQAEPSLQPSEIEARLKSGGVPITDPANGMVVRRVDAVGALNLREDMDGDGCSNAGEVALGLDPLNPWDFYSVPVPGLFAAPNPLVVVHDSAVSASDAQAVFAYFKAGAHTGMPVYEQDLNNNGIKDGIEYDRSVVGPAHSGPPDGTVSGAGRAIGVRASSSSGTTAEPGYSRRPAQRQSVRLAG
jgi:Subtilase family